MILKAPASLEVRKPSATVPVKSILPAMLDIPLIGLSALSILCGSD